MIEDTEEIILDALPATQEITYHLLKGCLPMRHRPFLDEALGILEARGLIVCVDGRVVRA